MRSWLDELPTGYARVPVGAAYEVKLGKMLTPRVAAKKGETCARPYLRNTNVQWGRIDTSDLKYMRFGADEAERYRLRPGDLVVCEGGQPGRCAIWEEPWTCFYQKALHRVRPRHDASSRWLAYVLEAAVHVGVFTTEDRSTISHLTAEDFRSLRVPLPSPSTQRRLSESLDRRIADLDGLIADKIHLVELLNERRRAVLLSCVDGRLTSTARRTASGLPWTPTVPVDWSSAKITWAARLGSGHTPSRAKPEYWTDCVVPWITTGEVAQIRDDRQEVITETRERISYLGLANSSAVVHPADTVVLCRTAGSAGYSGLMGTAMATSQDFATWTCSDRLLPRYLLFCLRAMRPDLLGRLATGATHRTIYMPDIEMLRIPLPSVDAQRQALNAADAQLLVLDPLVRDLSKQLALLREHRLALITAVVTGRQDSRVVAAAA